MLGCKLTSLYIRVINLTEWSTVTPQHLYLPESVALNALTMREALTSIPLCRPLDNIDGFLRGLGVYEGDLMCIMCVAARDEV